MNIKEVINSDKVDFTGITSSYFLLGLLSAFENRFQAIADSTMKEISWKQFFAVICINMCKEKPTVKELAEIMGSSHQNVKQILLKLEKKGFVRLVSGNGRSVQVVLTEKAELYEKKMAERQRQLLALLFSDFDVKETDELFRLYARLYTGMERAEKYAEEFE